LQLIGKISLKLDYNPSMFLEYGRKTRKNEKSKNEIIEKQ